MVPNKRKASKLNSMVLTFTKRNSSEVRLIFVDINIAGQQRTALIYMKASNLFISEKFEKKLGLSIKKSNNKIKMVNSEEAPIVGVAQSVELQIDEWKANKDFGVIHLDYYDFVLGLNLLDKIKAILFPFSNQIHIFDGPLSRIIVSVNRDMKVGTKVFSSIQLVEDVLYRRNIGSIEQNVMKAPSDMLVEHETDIKPFEISVELPPMGNVGCSSDFAKVVMQTG